MKALAWVYLLISIIIAGCGVSLIVLLVPHTIQEQMSPWLTLISMVTGIGILALWILFVRKISEENGSLVLFEYRPREPKPLKTKKRRR